MKTRSAHEVLKDLLSLYDWRNRVGHAITVPDARKYGETKKTLWGEARRVVEGTVGFPDALQVTRCQCKAPLMAVDFVLEIDDEPIYEGQCPECGVCFYLRIDTVRIEKLDEEGRVVA